MGGSPPEGAGHHVFGEYPTGDLSASQGLWIPRSLIVLSSLKLDCLSKRWHPPEELRAIILDLGTQGTHHPSYGLA